MQSSRSVLELRSDEFSGEVWFTNQSGLSKQRRKRQTSFATLNAYFVLELGSFAVGIVIPAQKGCQVASKAYTYKNRYHVSNLGILVVYHCVLKRFQEVFLKFEMRQLLLLKESHRKLAKRIQSENTNVRVIVATHLPCISYPRRYAERL